MKDFHCLGHSRLETQKRVTRARPRCSMRLIDGRALVPFCILCFALLWTGELARAQDSKPTINVVLDANRFFIAVTFSGGKPDSQKALDPNEWRVVAIPHDTHLNPTLFSVKPKFYERPNKTTDQAQVRLY